MSKLISISKSKIIKNQSLSNISKCNQPVKLISLNPIYIIDTVEDISLLEDSLKVVSNHKTTRMGLFRRARNILNDNFSSVNISDGNVLAGQNPFKYDIFEYVLSIQNRRR